MKKKIEFSINKKKIGLNYPTYFIADIAANHDGSLSKAKELIHYCAEAGADVATCPLSVITGLLKHPLTDIGLEKFLADYKKGN